MYCNGKLKKLAEAAMLHILNYAFNEMESNGDMVEEIRGSNATFARCFLPHSKDAFDSVCHTELLKTGYRGTLWGAACKVDECATKDLSAVLVGKSGRERVVDLNRLPIELKIVFKFQKKVS